MADKTIAFYQSIRLPGATQMLKVLRFGILIQITVIRLNSVNKFNQYWITG